MEIRVLKGCFVDAPVFGALRVREGSFLVLADGVIQGLWDRLPEEYAACPVTDYGEALVLPAFADLHLHAPQYPMLGMGMDLPLLDWLNTYTFPAEARFADPDYAREVYRKLSRELIACGTTRVCMFSSLHTDATLILMEELEKAGVTGYVGKVNMDRNGGVNLQETTEESIRETERWLERCGDFAHLRPILTPRFTPSCTDELMAWLGRTAAERDLPIQSHLSENDREIEWVRELHPDCGQYWETYAKYGLWNDRTLMAHCVWSDARERAAIRDAGVTVVHCAGLQRQCLLRRGAGAGHGGGGAEGGPGHGHRRRRPSEHVRRGDLRHPRLQDPPADGPGPPRLFDGGGGLVPGHQRRPGLLRGGPGLCRGGEAPRPGAGGRPASQPHPLTAQERLERCLYRRQEGAIRVVWSEGRLVLDRGEK